MARKQNPDAGTRAAMITGAIASIRENGVAATSFADVLARSGASRGSIYHHFPGGRAQLVEDATRSAARWLDREIDRILETRDVAGALRAIVDLWRTTLEQTDYRSGCPIVAAALGPDAGTRDIAAASFTAWRAVIASTLIDDGATPERAGSLATLVVAALEGALVLAQAERTSRPLDVVVDELVALCDCSPSA
ncbi:TetR/AcrR family transcriptional regulator [Rhodococcus rhodnii]|uniref:Transcriptional regulator n=2 Tax=Rhodococcus rhodnii TaxID=38312 RepID=R7WJ17_9NOCA|nr:TetR/AcrR family transcriptional regulator [Rhodococcus rhodnii]EOM75246.1 transcriptional regulator [Rhodococcus rhodnii LMG 5362]TXG89263.1 TetR/AcrR family transcriptional regulator [Rhodococcus rhodnii]